MPKPRRRRRQQQPPVSLIEHRRKRAMLLDRLADQQLQAGFHNQAERLAHAAAELREAVR